MNKPKERPCFKRTRPEHSFRRNNTTTKKVNNTKLSKNKEEKVVAKPKSICEMDDIKEFSHILIQCYPYYARYYHNAIAGERSEYGNEYVTIAYGQSIEELIVLCEEKGFSRSERLFDGGYDIRDNPKYNESLTPDIITHKMNRVFSHIFDKNQ